MLSAMSSPGRVGGPRIGARGSRRRDRDVCGSVGMRRSRTKSPRLSTGGPGESGATRRIMTTVLRHGQHPFLGRTCMGHDAARRWTADEFLRLPEDTRRVELLDGEIVVTPPVIRHQEVVMRLGMALYEHVTAIGGKAF